MSKRVETPGRLATPRYRVPVRTASEAHDRRSLVSWGFALALHAAAIGALFTGSRAPPPIDDSPVVEVTIETPPREPEEAPRPEPEAERPAPSDTTVAATPLARNAATSKHPDEAVIVSEAPPGPSSSASEGWAPQWTMPQGINLGLDGGIAWRPSLNPSTGDGTGEGAPATRPDVGMIRSALAEHDRELGFGSGGRITSAVRDANRVIADLREGAATMQVVTDATGHVVSVRLVDVTSNERGWTEAAEAVRSALGKSTLQVPSGARGVVVTVRIEVAMRLPSGARGSGVSSLINGDGVGGTADLSDLGARPRAVAKTRVLSEEAL